MTGDGMCGEVVLVKALDGRFPRMCIDAEHTAGTDHHCRFRGQVVPFTDGLNRVHVNTSPDEAQPVLV